MIGLLGKKSRVIGNDVSDICTRCGINIFGEKRELVIDW